MNLITLLIDHNLVEIIRIFKLLEHKKNLKVNNIFFKSFSMTDDIVMLLVINMHKHKSQIKIIFLAGVKKVLNLLLSNKFNTFNHCN